MELHERLKEIRTMAGISQIDLAEQLRNRGFSVSSNSTVSKWEVGQTEPSYHALGKAFYNDDYSAEGLYSRLNIFGEQQLHEYLDYLLPYSRYTDIDLVPIPQRVIKLFDMPVSAGTGLDLDGDDYTEIEADPTVPQDASFAVRLRGDSMTPRFVDNQIVFVKATQTLAAGDIGIFSLNGSAYCKRLTDKGLESLNSKYDLIPVGVYNSFNSFGA